LSTTVDTFQQERCAPILTADAVSFGYGSLRVVDQVSIQVGPGETVVLLGPNGAGKSTLMKGLIGHLPLLTGALNFDGSDISNTPSSQRVRLGVGYVPQMRDVFSTLSVWENLSMGGYALPRSAVNEQAEAMLSLFPALAKLRRRRAGTLSGGERKMLAIARALMTSPKVLILDEPTSNLAPNIARGVLEDVVARLSAAGQAVLMVEQRVEMALEAATFGYVLVQGQVRLGRPARVLRESGDELAQLFFRGGTPAPLAADVEAERSGSQA
jgi:branched-chain amino acid transport system ATP-binding protein